MYEYHTVIKEIIMRTRKMYRIYIQLVIVWNISVIVNGSYNHFLSKKSRCLNPPRTARRVETFIQECQEDVKNKLIGEAYQMIKQEVYKDYPQLDANDDSMHLMNDQSSALSYSAEHEITGSGSAAATAPSAPSGINEKGSELPTGYDTHQNEYSRRQVTRLLHRIRRIAYDPPNTIYHPTLVPFEDKRIAGCLLHCVYAKNNAIDKLGWPTLDGLVDFYSEGVNEHGFFMATLRSVNLCLRAVTIKYRVNRHKLPESGESCDLAFDVFDCISDQITGYCLDQYK